jgi:hypothetical protein
VVAAGAISLACQDVVSVNGACPEFCPGGVIDVRDTVLGGSVAPEGSFTGYVLPHEASEVQAVGGTGAPQSNVLLVFAQFGTAYLGSDNSVLDTIRSTDSLRFVFSMTRRNNQAAGLTLALHEIPATTDSTATYAGMAPYFDDSTLITTVAVPDSQATGEVAVTVLPGALRHFQDDSLRSAIGVRIGSADPAFVSFGPTLIDTVSLRPIARIIRFVQLDSTAGSVRVTRAESLGLNLKTFVVDSSTLVAPAGLVVGGPAAARAFAKLDVPQWLLDSTVIVRATLQVPPPQPTPGAPGDTMRLAIRALGTDFGPKSPLADSSYSGTVRVPVGGSDTVGVDIVRILLLWQSNSVVPHTVMLQLLPEAGSINTFELPEAGAVAQGVLRITYANRFRPGR